MTYYLIMELTPCPGIWQPLATCYIQDAEYHLGFNQYQYYERAMKKGGLFLYCQSDARWIILYRSYMAPYARHKLILYPRNFYSVIDPDLMKRN